MFGIRRASCLLLARSGYLKLRAERQGADVMPDWREPIKIAFGYLLSASRARSRRAWGTLFACLFVHTAYVFWRLGHIITELNRLPAGDRDRIATTMFQFKFSITLISYHLPKSFSGLHKSEIYLRSIECTGDTLYIFYTSI
jgi:hypothetical protein